MSQTTPGFNGKLLRVQLSENSFSEEKIDPDFCRKYLGGAGFITYYLFKELQAGVEPLSPDNKLIFSLGPTTGTVLIGSGRHCVGAKSPMTGGIALSEVGEFWGAEMKRSGYDIVIFEGKASRPVYLWIHDGTAALHDAGHLWGKNTLETQNIIRSELGDDKIRLAMIGPGGENLVRFACIMHGLHDTAGRGGLGAVMGSKNLKAVAVRGHHAPPIANPERLREITKWWMDNKFKNFAGLSEFGTGGPEMEIQEQMGNLPVRNFRDGLFPGVKNIHGQVMRDTIRVGMVSCSTCPVRCKKKIKLETPYQVNPDYGGPEYESIAALGSNCGVDNINAVVKANELCNAYSMDTISTGGVIAFAMECFERGLLTLKDTGGIELNFGNDAAMLQVIHLIARREGVGDILAEGTARLAKRIGQGSGEFAIHVKGLDAGLHEPRLKPGLGLGYMVGPLGADHCISMQDDKYAFEGGLADMRPLGILETLPLYKIDPRKVTLFKYEQAKRILFNSMVMCYFIGSAYNYNQLGEIVQAITGWDTGPIELIRIAERILTMARLFNFRQGLSADDDVLPKRFAQGKTDGALADKGLDFNMMDAAKKYYYVLMGWDSATGTPLPEKIRELGILS